MDKDINCKVKQLLDYEETIDQKQEAINRERQSGFTKEKPTVPQYKKVVRTYPSVKSNLKPDYLKWSRPLIATGILFAAAMVLSVIPLFSVLMAIVILADFFLAGAAAVYILYQRTVIFPRVRKNDEEKIRNSQEYRTACTRLDQEYDKKQAELDREYEAAERRYKEETAVWEKEYKIWKAERDEKICSMENELTELQTQRDRLYDELNAIPVHYRQTEVVRYIYHVISTSDYTIKEAINLYDRNEQRKIEEARLREQRLHNQLQEEANMYADEMNELQREANKTAAKTRRDMNIANAAHIYQNHKLGKTIEKMRKK